MKQAEELMQAVLAGLLLLGAFAALFAYLRYRSQAAAAARWPTAPGRILSSGVRIIGRSNGRVYEPAVRYDYVVGGRSFEGDRIRFGGRNSWLRRRALAAVEPYTEGAAVPVHYDPDRPEQAVLQTQPPHAAWLLVSAACLAGASAAGLSLF